MAKQTIKTMTEEEYHEAREDSLGYCLLCGAERGCCEPDARNYDCEECGHNEVFGVEELMIMGKVEIV